MRISVATLVGSSLLLASLGLMAPVLAADSLPPRKAGLWESKTTTDDGTMSAKQCIDAQTDLLAKNAVSGPGGVGDACSKQSVIKTATGYETESVCKFGPIETQGKGVVTGDFDSMIRMEMETTVSGVPGQSKPVTRKSTIENRWLGPCEAGQKPGDIIMSDGKVVRTPGAPK